MSNLYVQFKLRMPHTKKAFDNTTPPIYIYSPISLLEFTIDLSKIDGDDKMAVRNSISGFLKKESEIKCEETESEIKVIAENLTIDSKEKRKIILSLLNKIVGSSSQVYQLQCFNIVERHNGNGGPK